MLRMTRRCEYGIMAMKFIAANKQTKLCSSRTISEYFNIPPEILAKILQKLAKKGLIDSHKGKNGGYQLSKIAKDISLGDIIVAIENCIDIVDCSTEKGLNCDQIGICEIEHPMKRIQKDLNNYFHGIMLSELDDLN